jgi:4-amino-4-deoxy-L-arabinose transferase-like glycosyltransferase
MQAIRGQLDPEPTQSRPSPSRPVIRAALALLGLCLLVYLPGFFTIAPVDRDESRFAQASRQMFESAALPAAQKNPSLHAGGVIVPMVQARPRLNKPPLIYWLQSVSAAIFTGGAPARDSIWMYRVPSLLAAIAAAFLTWRLGASMFGEATGRLAAAALAICPIFAWEAHQARADMALVALTTGSMLILWRAFSGSHGLARSPGVSLNSVVGFWLLIAAGVMTKGPITPLVVAMTALTLGLASRKWLWLLRLRPAVGVLIVSAAVGPWVFAVGRQVGWDTYFATIAAETLGRSVSAKEGHWGPPGYHLALLPILFWPGSLLTAAAVAYAWRCSRVASPSRTGIARLLPSVPSADLFCLAWILPAWLMFELIGTKLPHYTMPLYPAIAILSARAVVDAIAPARDRLGPSVWLIIGVVIACGSVALQVIVARSPDGASALVPLSIAVATALLLIPLVARAWGQIRIGAHRALLRTGFIMLLLAWVPLAGLAIPRGINVSRDLFSAIHTIDPGALRPLAAVGYHEDSLIFLTRGRIERINREDLPSWFDAHPGGLAVVQLDAMTLPPGLESLAEIAGFNYSRGQTVRCALLQRPTHQRQP